MRSTTVRSGESSAAVRRVRGRVALFAVGAVALSAFGVYLGTGLHPMWWAAWLAPIPVFLLASRASRSVTAGAAFAAWALGGLNMWSYFRTDIGLPAPVAVIAIAWPAVVFAAVALLWRACLGRGWSAGAAFGAPALWVAAEYVTSVVSPHGTFGNLAYTQMDFLPLVQLASLCGAWGISFFVVFVPAVAAVLIERPTSPGSAALGAVSVVLVAAAVGFGAWRLSVEPAPKATVTVALAAADSPDLPLPLTESRSRELMDAYTASLGALSADGASVVVLPEAIAALSDSDLDAVRGRLVERESGRRIEVVAGFDLTSATVERNVAVAFDAAGPSAVYAKQHLIPEIEARFRAGDAPLMLERPGGRWGVAVCKDMDFPALGRRYATLGAGLMLVPAWDFGRDGWLHSRMAVLRAVEGGYAIARSARTGLLTVADDRGRVLAEEESGSAPVATLTATVPLGGGGTLYARLGDWFAWACITGLAVLAATAASKRRSGDGRTVDRDPTT